MELTGQCKIVPPVEQEHNIEYPLSGEPSIWITLYLGPRVRPSQPGTLSRWPTRRGLKKKNHSFGLATLETRLPGNKNVFVCFQTILTGVVNSVLSLDPRLQFEIYAIILLVPAAGFALNAILRVVLLSKRNNPVKFT